LPVKVETRFILALSECSGTDDFGNPSWFRKELAQKVKDVAPAERPYVHIDIPRLEIECPDHKQILQPWFGYPTPPLVDCKNCGRRSQKVRFDGDILVDVITEW